MAKMKRKGQADAECFRALPERAQEVWWYFCKVIFDNRMFEKMIFCQVKGFDYSFCNSPIEVIFNLAFDLICFAQDWVYLSLEPQYEVLSRDGSNKYFVDFAFVAENSEILSLQNSDYKLAIECDGHEFHEKTKEQVVRDNEREYELKLQGFDVLRFSGSQIYNSPFRCALQTIQYIREKIGDQDGRFS